MLGSYTCYSWLQCLVSLVLLMWSASIGLGGKLILHDRKISSYYQKWVAALHLHLFAFGRRPASTFKPVSCSLLVIRKINIVEGSKDRNKNYCLFKKIVIIIQVLTFVFFFWLIIQVLTKLYKSNTWRYRWSLSVQINPTSQFWVTIFYLFFHSWVRFF